MFDTLRRFVLAGGKRLRPLFCYWGWRGAGEPDRTEIVAAAAALELLDAYAAFGDPLGDAFQLRDDVLGVFGDAAVAALADAPVTGEARAALSALAHSVVDRQR